jgi:phenylacetate-coenzyme A ligase PaaK-like adenylate-forming protein
MIYGFTEAKMAWPECPYPEGKESGGFHLYPDLSIIEIVDPKTGESVGEGQPGEIVFTPLDARGTVVLRYRTGDLIDGGLVYEPCPHCGRQLPRLVGRISRTSEMQEMHLDKLKGTLVDFNQLEHVLDNFESIGTWQLELRKANDDPLELDELILHVEKLDQGDETRLRQELSERIAFVIEMHPNRIVFESSEKMRGLQGVGVQLKEQRLVDHRPKPEAGAAASPHGNGAQP